MGDGCGVGGFVATAGSLDITGPSGRQEVQCFRGQACSIRNLTGYGLKAGDRVTVVAQRCGSDEFMEGLPGTSIADTSNGVDYDFNDSALLQIPAGLFRLCWCRPETSQGISCNQSGDFFASAGLFAANGPLGYAAFTCIVNDPCNKKIYGVGLATGDKLIAVPDLGDDSCLRNSSTLSGPYGGLAGGQYNLTRLTLSPLEAILCWCPVGEPCVHRSSFGAMAARLRVECWPGSFRSRSTDDMPDVCSTCPLGSFCPGGYVDAKVYRCPPSMTTHHSGANSSEECVCQPGYLFDRSLGGCKACPSGKFKSLAGNDERCEGICPQDASRHAATGEEDCYCSACAESDNESLGGDLQAVVYTASAKLKWSEAGGDSDTQRLSSFLREVIFGFSEYDKIELEQSGKQGRRLQQQQEILMHVHTGRKDRVNDLQQLLHPNVFSILVNESSANFGLEIDMIRNFTQHTLKCEANRVFPRNHPALSLDECKCAKGYQLESTSLQCRPCAAGKYKEAVGDDLCRDCSITPSGIQLTTRNEGQTSQAACRCPAGYEIDPRGTKLCRCPVGLIEWGGCQWAHIPIGCGFLALTALTVLMCVVRRARARAFHVFQQRLESFRKDENWERLHKTKAGNKTEAAFQERIIEEVRQESMLRGVKMSYILDVFDEESQLEVDRHEWRLFSDGRVMVKEGFINRCGNEAGCALWEASDPIRAPENPDFEQMAPVIAYGDNALGKGLICPRDGEYDCSLTDALSMNQAPPKESEASSMTHRLTTANFDVIRQRIGVLRPTAASEGSEACDNAPCINTTSTTTNSTVRSLGKQRSGKANRFLSWAWRYKKNMVLQALRQHARKTNLNPEDICIWWCWFCNNQFRLLQEKVARSPAELQEVFGDTLKSVGRMWMCLDRIKDSLYTTRIWCVFELYIATTTDVPCDVIMDTESHEGTVGEIQKFTT
eukprot:TRINITY_DN16062_c0_g1_i2.p1 TRINITY_DN16062_c0_g1~~TRINITY_DN16062_c0_g1_i2.p1  ORF type:complete len:1086 (+),score=137.38 TRINITY_DN16062_c0_g1_i2:418-3258(+)